MLHGDFEVRRRFDRPVADGAEDVAHLRGSVTLAWNAMEAALP